MLRVVKKEQAGERMHDPETTQDLLNVIQGVAHDSELNKHANYYSFRDAYRNIGKDLDAEFASRKQSSKTEGIHEDFMGRKLHSFDSQLGETLPLYANKKGRLGDNIQANVFKTAKQDDQGNSFVDLVMEVKNNWLATDAPLEMQDIPAKFTFLIDVTTAQGGDYFHHKEHALKKELLEKGANASVLCYEDGLGKLGIERPKLLVRQNPVQLMKFGHRLGQSMTKLAYDKFSINRPESFDREYREYFADLMNAIGENAASNAAYIRSLPPDPKRIALAKEYEKIVKFVEAYNKTPTKRTPKGTA